MLNLIFPKFDINSKNIGKYIESRNFRIHDEICYKCKKYSPGFKTHKFCNKNLNKVITCFYYTENIKKYILNFKYYHRKQLNIELGQLLYYFFQIYLGNLKKEKTILTYIPMHRWRKYFIKGYNQGELLANKLGKLTNIEVKKICNKIKYTKPQTKTKSRKERLNNLRNSFGINKVKLENNIKNIVIVDDLITTGATLEEVSSCIKKSYPDIKIYALIFARK